MPNTMNLHPGRNGLALLLLPALLLAFSPPLAAKKRVRPQDLQQARGEVAEEVLLDVGIEVFDPGLPSSEEERVKKGIFPDIRSSEARYIPFHLKETLESTGYWGAVRVVPAGARGIDVRVSGRILESNGMDLELQVEVSDATGNRWLDKRYNQRVDSSAYAEGRVEDTEAYQHLYNQIANEMLAVKQRFGPSQVRSIREVAQLQFAADLAPGVFDGYLSRNRKGEVERIRAPAEDDPMMERVLRIRERDYMFVDTLNQYYSDFYTRMDEAYDDWRAYSYEEAKAYKEMKRKGRTRKILGALLIVGAVASGGGGDLGSLARDAALVGGSLAIKSGIDKSREAKIHREAMKELAASFDAEMAPLLVEVEGHTLRLEGTAEAQYTEWRELLREIFSKETGFEARAGAGGGDANLAAADVASPGE